MKISLAVESDLAGLDFSFLLVHFVSNQNDWDVIANTGEILVPLGDILVGDSGGDIEHDDGCVCTNVVSLSESSKFFLSGGIPEGKLDGSKVGIEGDGTDFDSLGSNVFLFELAGDMSFDVGSFADSSISNQDDLKLCDWFNSLNNKIVYLHKLMTD